MRRRPGITLIEVLVAIFIMTIGLLALLTLFPLGALRMAQALQDDRDAAAASADQGCDIFGVRNDPQYNPPAAIPGQNPPPSMFATTPRHCAIPDYTAAVESEWFSAVCHRSRGRGMGSTSIPSASQ